MSNKIYIKVNGVWREADSVYRKRNGEWHKASDDVYKMINSSWINQNDKSAIFDPDALFVYNNFRVDENVSAHIDVTCFDGGDGSVTVVASGGTPPYQYSLDPTFATYNTDGVFNNLALVGPVDEGTDEYGGILISHRRFYVRDASGQIVYCIVDLKSPVALEWLNVPGDIVAFCDPAQSYATVDLSMIQPSTRANGYYEVISGKGFNNRYGLGSSQLTYECENDCEEYAIEQFHITVLPRLLPNAVQDYDGNWYDAVVIGDQVWLASNLRTTHYADGTAINESSNIVHSNESIPYYFKNHSFDENEFEYYYNHHAVSENKLFFDNWHVPTTNEIQNLITYVSSETAYLYDSTSNSIAKSLASTFGWSASATEGSIGYNIGDNNKTLLSITPSGWIFDQNAVNNNYWIGVSAHIWASDYNTATGTGYMFNLNPDDKIVTSSKITTYNRRILTSVRCVCDLSPLDFAAWYYQQYGSYNHQV